ncbi:hypothetical protein C8J57DRAFT_1230600 [Mycena rebaudengoi]|nr:hypothetical protein C8J57DRAFT_1247781 [Mycena rebaudengoi]KAJ7242729.1 hypothetical protein C8J57DRAFT_1243936 [Mycena rebaudengoi]KAJ7264840.1 hypothetical protein C8J57DRAFT_1230600 [Mycena rebaudengoi]
MRAQAFNFLCLFGVIFTLFASVVASPTTDIDFKELASKPGLVLSGLLEPPHERRQTGVGTTCGPVTGANVTGTCFNANTTCCNGFYSVGFCPGPSNVRCCTIIQHCRGGNGFCNDVNHVSCSVPYISGLCPGPSNVRCCRGDNGVSKCTPGGP